MVHDGIPQAMDDTSRAQFPMIQQGQTMMTATTILSDKAEDEHKDRQAPSISRLREISLVSEFSSTLDWIMETHQNPKNTDPEYFIPSLDTIAAQSVHQPLEIWCPLVSESSMSLFIHKFHVQDHLNFLHRFFLFGDDIFSGSIVSALFGGDKRSALHAETRTYGRQWPPRASDLNMSLRAVLLESIAHIPDKVKRRIARATDQYGQTLDIDDMITFGVRETRPDSTWRDPRAINAFDFLYLVYQVPYPISVVITPRILEKYNRLFSFLLQIHRLNAATNHIYQKLHQSHVFRHDTASMANEDALHRMRFRIDQFMTTFGNYVFDTAIRATWKTFMQQVEVTGEYPRDQDDGHNQQQSSDLFAAMDPILFSEYHEHVLDRMLFQCFLKQSQRPIRAIIEAMFEDVLDFSQALDDSRSGAGRTDEKRCGEVIRRFGMHAEQFVKVLNKLHDRGVGRLGNVMNSLHDQGASGLFGDFYDKREARQGEGAFAATLLTQLDISGFYVNDN
ncbi:Spc98 family-domain-containing protein [Dichotomocladium elegans]|nr:Spc98 family-domain-containing protein [Dichotomocladium elegans]